MTPGEVESMITAHPDVLRCVVVTALSAGGDPVLVAHYVLRPGATLSAAELRARLGPVRRPGLVLRRHAMFPPTRNGTVELDPAHRAPASR